jgi:hypothetical protein
MKGELKYKTKEKTGEVYPVIPVEKSEDSSNVESDKNKDTLVFLEDRRKKQIDETIDSPERYVSRYHYDSKNLDNYLELCPHCRKPNLSSYRKVVVDSALNYLEDKEEQRGRHVNRSMFVGLTAGLLLISVGLYYLLFHVISGARV